MRGKCVYQRVEASKLFMSKNCLLGTFAMANDVFNSKNVRKCYYASDYQHAYPLRLQLRNSYMAMVFIF